MKQDSNSERDSQPSCYYKEHCRHRDVDGAQDTGTLGSQASDRCSGQIEDAVPTGHVPQRFHVMLQVHPDVLQGERAVRRWSGELGTLWYT